MESLVKFFDVVDEFVVAAVPRLQRALSPRARERRAVYRMQSVGNQNAHESRRKQASKCRA